MRKSRRVDNVPAELLKNELIRVLTAICQRKWETKQWPKDWTQSLITHTPKKGNLRLCEKVYMTISLISHPSKVVLRVLLNRIKGKAEGILAEEQTGFRPKRSTVERILNARLLIEKHLHHQRVLYLSHLRWSSPRSRMPPYLHFYRRTDAM